MTDSGRREEQENIQLELPLDASEYLSVPKEEPGKQKAFDSVDSKLWEEAIESTGKDGKITFRKRKKQKSSREEGYYRPETMGKKGAFSLSERARAVFGVLIMVIAGLDLFGMAPLSRGLMFNLSDWIFYALGLDEVSYMRHTVTEMRVTVSLIVAAIIGGFLINLFLQLVLTISEGLHLKTERRYYLWMLAALVAVFGLLSFISINSGNSYSSYKAFEFLAPLSMYGGGLLIYGIAVLKLEAV